MRQISPKAITLFSFLTIGNVFINAVFCFFLYLKMGIPQQALYFIIPITFYLSNIITFRLLFSKLKFPLHEIHLNTSEDFAFQIYVLYYLIFFNFFIHNALLPVPISRIFHQMLGAKFGSGSYSAGVILDPSYVEIGDDSIIGFNAVVCSHAIEGAKVSFEKVMIGNNVTIGLRAMIMQGVIIEDHAIVAAGALVTKNTHIKKGEVWAGIPAKLIKQSPAENTPTMVLDFLIKSA